MLIAKYKNGNYVVELYSDGTKVKTTLQDDFSAEFPDSLDLKITNYCDLFCSMCHENSSASGKHANLSHPILSTLKKGTEIAIGGGNPLSHPNLVDFLQKLKTQGVIANLTVNEKHFLQNQEFLQDLLDKRLIWGLGISLNEVNCNTLAFASKNKNVVLHLIAGIFDRWSDIFDKQYKILILGYKVFGRGESFYNERIAQNIKILKDNLKDYFSRFKVISFDNLALKQLGVKNLVDEQTWENCFMGNDGDATMYIDLVKEQFALSSTSEERFALKESITEAFSIIKNQT